MVGDGGFLRQPWVKAGLVRDHDNDKGQEKKRVDVKNWSGDVFVSMHLAIQAEGIVLKKGLAYRATEKRTYRDAERTAPKSWFSCLIYRQCEQGKIAPVAVQFKANRKLQAIARRFRTCRYRGNKDSYL